MRIPAMITDASDLKDVKIEFTCPNCHKIAVNHTNMANIHSNNNRLVAVCNNCDTNNIKIRIKSPDDIKSKIVLTIIDNNMTYAIKASNFSKKTINTIQHYLDGFIETKP